MKKINLLLSLFTLASAFTVSGCTANSSPVVPTSSTIEGSVVSSSEAVSEYHNVTFVLNNGEGEKTRKVKHGSYAIEPSTFKKEFFVIEGWYTDEACEIGRFNFNTQPITSDIKLYAKWEVDYQNWVWRLGRVASKETVMLYVQSYETASSSRPFSAGFGSGVIIYDDGTYFYALTNNHVVAAEDKDGNYKEAGKRVVTMYDHYHNEYNAEVIAETDAYDLALVKFKNVPDKFAVAGSFIYDSQDGEGMYAVKVATFAAENPEVGADVASLGSPVGQQGVVNIGKIFEYSYGTLEMPGISNIRDFKVIKHDASILGGNSGGPLFDAALNLVGINYGSSGHSDTYNTSGNFWAIPIENVRTFIDDEVCAYYPQYDFLGEL